MVVPPAGRPALPSGLALPSDLLEFYDLCGGVTLFADYKCAGHIELLPPHRFQRIDLAINGECFATGPFQWWYALADVRDGNYVAIDLNPDHAGNCYDAFHETFAMPGYVKVVAVSFTDFVQRLLNHHDDSTYWLQDDFEDLGEAFALYGYSSIG